MFPFTQRELLDLAALLHLQADAMAEEGNREGAQGPARVAARLEMVVRYAERRGADPLHLG